MDSFRSSVRPLPKLARRASIWALFLWWLRGGSERLEIARARREIHKRFPGSAKAHYFAELNVRFGLTAREAVEDVTAKMKLSGEDLHREELAKTIGAILRV